MDGHVDHDGPDVIRSAPEHRRDGRLAGLRDETLLTQPGFVAHGQVRRAGVGGVDQLAAVRRGEDQPTFVRIVEQASSFSFEGAEVVGRQRR